MASAIAQASSGENPTAGGPGVFYPDCVAALQVVFDGFGGSDKAPIVIQVFPKSATVHLNGYSEADSWDLTFDAKDLPFDPALVRTAAVHIWMFGKRTLQEDASNYITEDNLLIAGLANKGSFRIGSDGRTWSASGNDYTELLTGRPWEPTERVPTGKPLDQIVQDLVDAATIIPAQVTQVQSRSTGIQSSFSGHGGRVMTVKYEGEGTAPVVGSGLTKTKGKRGVTVAAGKNYFDVIYGMCLKHGFIAFVRGTDVVISEPNSLTKKSLDKIRVVAYGRDLSSLESERDFGKEQVPQIVVSAYDGNTRQIATASYPEDVGERVTGIGTKKDERLFVTAPAGVRDVGLLREFARTYYNNLARGEIRYRFSTRDLVDLRDKSMLHLRAGHPMLIRFDAFNKDHLRQLSNPERVKELKDRGYSDVIAALVANGIDQIKQFEQPFYLKEMTLSWSNTDGLTIEGECMNFAVVDRDDQDVSLVQKGKAVLNAASGSLFAETAVAS